MVSDALPAFLSNRHQPRGFGVQPGRRESAPEEQAVRGRSQGLLTRAQRALEDYMPARTAPVPPTESNPFQQAIDAHDRVSRDLAEVIAERDDLRERLIGAYHRAEALESRLESEGNFYRDEIEKLRAERDAFARTCVEMASANDAVSEAANQVVKLALRSREIVLTYRDHLREAHDTPAEQAGQVEGMSAPISEVLNRLPRNEFT